MSDVMLLKEGAVKKLNMAFRSLSTILQDSTTQYALFRCRLTMIDEDTANLLFLASDDGGRWKNVSLDVDFDNDNIFYSKKVIPFENERNILLQVDNLINYALESFPVDVGDIYWDLNNISPFSTGYVCNTAEGNILVLDNGQCRQSNLCTGDAFDACEGDRVITMDWTTSLLQDYANFTKGIDEVNSANQ